MDRHVSNAHSAAYEHTRRSMHVMNPAGMTVTGFLFVGKHSLSNVGVGQKNGRVWWSRNYTVVRKTRHDIGLIGDNFVKWSHTTLRNLKY